MGVGALSPGLALLASGVWVWNQGGGLAVLGVGAAALALGLFVLIFIGAALRRSVPST